MEHAPGVYSLAKSPLDKLDMSAGTPANTRNLPSGTFLSRPTGKLAGDADASRCIVVERAPWGVSLREKGSLYTGDLSRGCVLCGEGAKLVLFITGLCDHSCFYCPLSEKKAGSDVIYANERRVTGISGIIEEAELMDAGGTGITGGEPLLRLDRTCDIMFELKKRFGGDHHIHLYTRTPADADTLTRLKRAGLDEIRFHIPTERNNGKTSYGDYRDSLGICREIGLDLGVEVPAFPDREKELVELARFAGEQGAGFINLNELEMNYINYSILGRKGYSTIGGVSSAVAGSADVGGRVVKHYSDDKKMNVHLCTVAFKDGVQLTNRIGRRAKNVKRPFEEISKDNTLIRALIECDPTDENMEALMDEFEIPGEMIAKDEKNRCLTTAWYIAEEIDPYIGFRCVIVEEYPTFDRLEVERRYLDKKPSPEED